MFGALTEPEIQFMAVYLEGFFCGFYTAIFAMYLQHHGQSTDKTKNILFYALCALYILSLANFVLDMANFMIKRETVIGYDITVISTTIFGCSDFIAQSILIYRCWIVWGRNIRVVIIPLILSIVFLAAWIAVGGVLHIVQGRIFLPDWGSRLSTTSLAISMTVNALVTGLIVFRIFKVFQEVKPTPSEKALGATSSSSFRPIVFVLIESGVVLFAIQLARFLGTILPSDSTYKVWVFFTTIHQMLNGITPTIVVVRVSMGLSFYDEQSMVEAAESLRFNAPDNESSEIGCISRGVHQESTCRDDHIGIDRSDDIDIVERV